MMIYTGIGPRNAPPKVLEVCEQIGAHMAKRKWRLRTGAGSDAVSCGCDLAFLKGAESHFPHQDCGIIWSCEVLREVIDQLAQAKENEE